MKKGNKMQKLVEQVWDYTKHKQFYSYRPNYAPKTIDMLISLVGKKILKWLISVQELEI